MKAKKIILTLTCTAAIVTVAACGGSNKDQNTSANISVSDQNSEGEDENVQIANPWTDCKTLNDAIEHTGFSLEVPETIAGYSNRFIQTLDKEIIQVIYQNGKETEDDVTIRKGHGSDDISGDYNEYSEINTVTVGKYQVTEKGNNGEVMLATWNDGEYAYSVCTAGMSMEEMTVIIQQIK